MRRLYRSPRSPFFRLAGRKLAKAYDQLIYKKSLWDEESRSLKARIQLLQPRKRVIVKPNPNEKFVNIEQIMKAKEEVKVKEALEQRRAETWQRDHSPERVMNQYSFEELCSQWQL